MQHYQQQYQYRSRAGDPTYFARPDSVIVYDYPNLTASVVNYESFFFNDKIKINRKLNQLPDYRDTHAIILQKSRSLQSRLTPDQRRNLHAMSATARCLTAPAHRTGMIADASIQLTVTSPPFLDVVQYARDNWLRCWFNALDADAIAGNITMSATISDWRAQMSAVFAELYRITARGGRVEIDRLRREIERCEQGERITPGLPQGRLPGHRLRGGPASRYDVRRQNSGLSDILWPLSARTSSSPV